MYDFRNPTKPSLAIKEFQTSCSSMFYDQYFIGLDNSGSIKITTNGGVPVMLPNPTVSKKFNLS